MIDQSLLKSEERAIFSLRELYKQYGYMPYKMSKFEEYDLYVSNKDFLISDRVITFNDTNGKLMALKPDVTLSIIKNAEDAPGEKTKVYYNENVYRISDSTHQYKEIMQAGLECIGDIDGYDIYEAVYLAAKSLERVGGSFVLAISHLDILTSILDEISTDEKFRAETVHCIKEKNKHDIERICKKYSVDEASTAKLCTIAGMYGKIQDVIAPLRDICKSEQSAEALDELCKLCELFSGTEYEDKIFIDFSIVNDMNYYNGIVFKGFIDGICTGVLAGGRYDKLMRRMGRSSGAVGFALYLDLLEELGSCRSDYDVDVLLLYDRKTNVKEISETVSTLTKQGKSVSARKSTPEKLRYREILYLGGESGK